MGQKSDDQPSPKVFYIELNQNLTCYLACSTRSFFPCVAIVIQAFEMHLTVICSGKLKLKFELASYQEKVVSQLKKMSKDSQELIWYKKKIAKQERSSKALEEAFWLISQKLKKHEEENKIVRDRTQLYHDQNKEEVYKCFLIIISI